MLLVRISDGAQVVVSPAVLIQELKENETSYSYLLFTYMNIICQLVDEFYMWFQRRG